MLVDSVCPAFPDGFAPNGAKIVEGCDDAQDSVVLAMTLYEMDYQDRKCTKVELERVFGTASLDGAGKRSTVPDGTYALWGATEGKHPINHFRSDGAIVRVFRETRAEMPEDGHLTGRILADRGFDPDRLIPIRNPYPEN